MKSLAENMGVEQKRLSRFPTKSGLGGYLRLRSVPALAYFYTRIPARIRPNPFGEREPRSCGLGGCATPLGIRG